MRDRYDYVDAVITNSLFLDFLLKNGLKVTNGTTKDIIDIDFNYGAKSYEGEISKLNRILKEAQKDYDNETNEHRKEHYEKRIQGIQSLIEFANNHKDRFVEKNKEDIRIEYYKNGVSIGYPTFYKNGELKKIENYNYKMLYRSTGKAKKGSCIFIVDRLYKKAKDFLQMGLTMPKENAPIVEMGAYSSLIASAIVGRVKIDPENILILNDVKSTTKKDVVSIEIDDKKHCFAKTIKDYEVSNEMFDGQALIDSSIFPEWGDGYILLRHHFCKMAAFNTNIQQFFRDYFGDNYENAKVVDMFGNEHYAKDIQLITTNNAMKWIGKFGNVTYDYWCSKVKENGSYFGIVKTSHPSKLGDVQKMSYQMINSLDLNTMGNVVNKSVQYINALKSDDDTFLDYLRANATFSNDYDVLVALCEQDKEFVRSEYYRKRKKAIINAYTLKFKIGKVIQNADNLTIVGSPYAMLLHSVGENVENDDCFEQSNDYIECYTERFDDGEFLSGFRSPHNSKNNIAYFKNNKKSDKWKYFNLGRQIIAINMLHTDIQDRANGCDMDSDSMYVTNQDAIVENAKICYKDYPTIVNNIPKDTNHYANTMEDFAKVDNKLAASQLAIGESSNLAQLALTYTYNFDDKKYIDYVCILSVVAQAAIDSAKRAFDIDINAEIKRIKRDMDIKKNGYPLFWKFIKDNVNMSKINFQLKCPMNYLCNMKFRKYRSSDATLPMSYFFNKDNMSSLEKRKKSKRVEQLIKNYSLELYNFNTNNLDEDSSDYLLLRHDFDEMIEAIKRVYISKNYEGLMYWLIDRSFMITPYFQDNVKNVAETISSHKPILLKTLYTINPKLLLKCFAKNVEK